MDGLVRLSRSSRSRSLREVTCCPSRPEKGEVLTDTTTERVGSSTCVPGERPRVLGVAQGLAEGRVLESGDGHDVARRRLGYGHPVEALEAEQVAHLRTPRLLAGARRPPHLLAPAQAPLVIRPITRRPTYSS